MSDPANYSDKKIRITNEGGLGRKTVVSIGETIIPVREVDIRIRPDELIEVNLVVKPGSIDIEALAQYATFELPSQKES